MAADGNTHRTFTDAELDALTDADRDAVERANVAVDRLALLPRSVQKALGHQNSKRGKRRALALLLGHQNDGEVRVHRLRAACRREGLLASRGDLANFTQDMKKDSTENPERALWSVHTYRSYGRELSGYWLLTEKGARLAAEYGRLVEAAETAAEAKADADFAAAKEARRVAFSGKRERLVAMGALVAGSIKITKKAVTCPYCRDEVTEHDKVTDFAECDLGCGAQAHGACVEEMLEGRRRLRCPANLGGYGARYRNNIWCHGHYTVKVSPAVVSPAVAENGTN